MTSQAMCPYCKYIDDVPEQCVDQKGQEAPFTILIIGRCPDCQEEKRDKALEETLLAAAMEGVAKKHEEVTKKH